jgi:SAM-dependent methyltransferase
MTWQVGVAQTPRCSNFDAMKKLISWLIRHVPRKYLQRISGIAMRLLAVFYRGNKVTCPVCEKSFREFLPYGRLKPRPNALCPSCLSLERHRLIWLFLQHETGFFNIPMSVLHIAPEACFISRFEKLHGNQYITADIESPLAKVKMDIHQIPFDADSFDMVLCNHVLEHVNNDVQAISEITRVLRPGGKAILQVPFFNPVPAVTLEDPSIRDKKERERLFGQDDHVRKYGLDYPQRIKRGGLTPFESQFVNQLSEIDRVRYGLVQGEIIYGGIKSAPSK